MVDSVIRLKDLLPGQIADVFRVEGQSDHVHRLEEFGLGRGTRLEMFRAGNPCIVRMAGNKVCLRLDRALEIDVSHAPAFAARREIMNANRTEKPHIVVTARFVDFNNTGILTPDNPGIILIEVTNTGLGSAYEIRPEIQFRFDVEGVTIAQPGSIGKLLPNLSGRLRIPVRIVGDPTADTAVIDIRILERWGFDFAQTLSVTIRLR